MTATTTPVDMATEPFLSGRFAPVHHEISADHLGVTGTIPTDLTGAYLRNGPNPEFPPLGSYTYPLEGDGMLHGVWLEAGQARYANRYVRTQGMKAEERAGHAIFGGLMTPAFVDTALLGDDPDPGWPFKLDAFIHIVRHGGHYLALAEGSPPYEVSPALDTIGRYDATGGMCAHPKIDPVTGEMVIFRYDVEAPFLSWSTIGADGTVTQPPVAVDGVDEGYMIHDFAITASYVVLVVGPMQFDLDAMMTGGNPLAWKPELGTRIAVIPRDRKGPTRWIHHDAFWAWHYANAFEDGGRIHLDFPYSSAPAMMLAPDARRDITYGFTRATLDPAAGTADLQHLDAIGTEFPRIDDRLTGLAHRYLTVAGRSGSPALQMGEHDVLYRYDMTAGTSTRYDAGAAIGEVTFAPRTGSTHELDGYYLAFGTGLVDGSSSLYIWDAAEFPAPPVATVHIPQRIPNGLHGNWFAADGS
ncbi:MAG: carotenoid oxygenase family protein [Ilumatobacteraceae bacterium]